MTTNVKIGDAVRYQGKARRESASDGGRGHDVILRRGEVGVVTYLQAAYLNSRLGPAIGPYVKATFGGREFTFEGPTLADLKGL